MNDSNDNRKPVKAQGGNSKVTQIQVPTDRQMPLPRTFEGKNYYATADVAKIIGVTKAAIIKWRNKNWFLADLRTHDGVYLYEVERVLQLKSVYHKDWMRGGYQPSPTTTAVEPPEKRDDQNSLADLISTKEAAAILGVSTSTLKKWREQKLFGVPFFTADEMHSDTWYYHRERVEQLKSIYHKGILQNIYKLAKLNPDPFVSDAREKKLSSDFQKPATTVGNLIPEGTFLQKPTSRDFFPLETVAMMLGINPKTLRSWRDKKIFVENYQNHVGIFFYSEDRIQEMKIFLQKDDQGRVITTPSPEMASSNAPTTPSFSNVIQADDPIATIKKLNGSLRPSKIRVEINEKLAKVIFKMSEQETNDLLNGNTFNIIEKRNHKKHGDILTAYKILNAAGYHIQRPLTLFDRFVLAACISEYLAGNRYTTPSIIYRHLTGKIKKGRNAKPSKDQLAAIIDSIKILIYRNVDYDSKELCKVLGYNDGKSLSIKGPLLPAVYFEASEKNGLNACTIFFLAEPPLLSIAKAKGQLISYDSTLLDIPRQQNTLMNIKLKNYCMLRVQEILAHKQLTPTITFRDAFEKARMEDADRMAKLRAREFINTFFEHLQNNHIIDSFEITKNHGTFYSIKFIRPSKTKFFLLNYI